MATKWKTMLTFYVARRDEMTDLIPMDITPIKLFSENGLEPILSEIKKKVDEFEPDVETGTGRKEIASFAYKIAQSKTFIEKAGKELVSKQKAAIKLIDAERKRSRDFLDEQRDKARQPLTEWEEAEKKALEEEERKTRFEADHTEALEFHALWLKDKELEALKEKIAMEAEIKAEEEEASRIKQEEIEREDRLKKEVIEKVIRETQEASERILQDAKDAAERKVKEAKEAVEKAERDKIAAKEKAEREKKEAIDRIRQEAEEKAERTETERQAKEVEAWVEKEAERIAAEKKAANLNHKRRIDREVIASFVGVGWPKADAEHIAGSIANGEISHVTITY